MPDAHDKAGTEIRSAQCDIDAVARTVIRRFDEVAREYGGSAYRSTWGEHFPRAELEALRSAWRGSAGSPKLAAPR